MKRRFNISAAQMVIWSVLGALVACSGFVLTALGSRLVPRSSAAFVPYLIFSFTLSIAGLALSLKSESSLMNGIAAERWPEEKIVVLRDLVRSKLWKVLYLVLTVAGVIACVGEFAAAKSAPYHALFWGTFIFSMTLYRLRAAVIPVPAASPTKVTDWNDGSPLQSRHWGER
jgi:hypothetical protein